MKSAPRILSLLAGLLALHLAQAAETTPAPVVLIDASRSSGTAAIRDRLQFLTDVVLPGKRRLVAFDQEVREVPNTAAMTFAGRYSDYLRAVETIATLPVGVPVLVVGDGQMEAVYPGMPPAYTQGLPATADRLAVNAALTAQAVRRLGAMKGLIALDSGGGPGLWAAVPTARIAKLGDLTALVELAQRCGTLPVGEPAPEGVLNGTGRVALEVPEGCSDLHIWLSLPDPAGAAVVSLVDPAGAALPTTGNGPHLAVVDGEGVARVYAVQGAEAGMHLELRIADAAGLPAAAQIFVVRRFALRHRMQAAPTAGLNALFTKEQAVISHRFLRGPGDTPVSEALDKVLRQSLRLEAPGLTIADPACITLPPPARKLEVTARFAAPWAGRIVSEPLSLAWAESVPLVARAEFALAEVYDGDPVELRAQAAGGKQVSPTLTLTVRGADGSPREVALKPVAGQAGAYAATMVFTETERGAWTIDVPAGVRGAEKGTIVAGAIIQVQVVRNLIPWIVGGSLLLLALLAALIWWWRSRPRWQGEILRHAAGDTRFADLPGPRARDTSYGLEGFGQRVLFTVERQRLVLAPNPEVRVWLNAQPVTGIVAVPPGSDVEIDGPAGRVHARIFASPAEADAWTHAQALIAPRTGTPDEWVIIESGS